jgi:hypothetical protein
VNANFAGSSGREIAYQRGVRRSTRSSDRSPAMIAALIAPIEMPTTRPAKRAMRRSFAVYASAELMKRVLGASPGKARPRGIASQPQFKSRRVCLQICSRPERRGRCSNHDSMTAHAHSAAGG